MTDENNTQCPIVDTATAIHGDVEDGYRSPSPTRRSSECPPAPKKKNHRRSNSKTPIEGSVEEEAKKNKKQVNYVFTDKRREAFFSKCVPANKAANQQRKEAKENKLVSADATA